MHEQETSVTTSDGEMKVFHVHPSESGPFPVALLLMDAIGFRDQIRANASEALLMSYTPRPQRTVAGWLSLLRVIASIWVVALGKVFASARSGTGTVTLSKSRRRVLGMGDS